MKSSHSQTMRLQTWIAESLKCFIKAVLQSETEGLSHSCTPCKLHVNNKTSLIIISRNCTTPSVGWDYMVVYPDNHQQWRGSPIWRATAAAAPRAVLRLHWRVSESTKWNLVSTTNYLHRTLCTQVHLKWVTNNVHCTCCALPNPARIMSSEACKCTYPLATKVH